MAPSPVLRSDVGRNPAECNYRDKVRIRRSRVGVRNPSTAAQLSSEHWHGDDTCRKHGVLTRSGGKETIRSDVHEGSLQENHDGASSGVAKSLRERQCSSNDHELNPHVSIVATHDTPQNTHSPQLFYGPSSNFAFLQQLHRGILSKTARGRRRKGNDVEEGGPGLDMFLQRSIFFGTPQRVQLDSTFPTGSVLIPQVDLCQAAFFLERFKEAHSHLYPFMTDIELDTVKQRLQDSLSIITGEAPISPQKRIMVLSVLAIGAMATSFTEQAEYLYALAKREALLFSEAVTLSMIQVSVLLAGYQIYTGRPHSAYIHMGSATRNAFSMGLHRDAPSRTGHMGNVKERQATLWSLYFHERWTGLTLGRKGAISIHDISCPFPDDMPVMTAMCQLAYIMEDCVELIYTRRCESLRQLYELAERIHTRLRQFGDKFKIGPSSSTLDSSMYGDVASFKLNAHYYHAILLTFRPFLVASAFMPPQARQKEGIWLRQACRYAIGAAEDSITYINDIYQSSKDAEVCKSLRYTCYFIECCCSVLLHDSLWCPSKMPHHLEYIQTALQCLEAMVNDEPVTLGLQSIRRILQAVEHAIAHGDGSSTTTTPLRDQEKGSQLDLQSPVSGVAGAATRDQQHIYFTDLWDQSMASGTNHTSLGWDNEAQDISFDVMTTDLLHFFAPDPSYTNRFNII